MLDFRSRELEFQMLKFIAKYRNKYLNCFFYILDYIDKAYFIFLSSGLAYVFLSKKIGLHLLILLLINTTLNYSIKYFFKAPRPGNIYDGISLLDFRHSYSFPSGAAQTSLLLPLFFIYNFDNNLTYILGFNFFIFISFSRLYLGVHFPLDIIAGWCVGATIFLGYVFINNIEISYIYECILWAFFISMLSFRSYLMMSSKGHLCGSIAFGLSIIVFYYLSLFEYLL